VEKGDRLKVPKYDIFDRSDFQSLSGWATLGLNNIFKKLMFARARHHFNAYAHKEHTQKLLMSMLSALISSCCVCSVHASAPDAYAHIAQHV
jgi:hypothetical protein